MFKTVIRQRRTLLLLAASAVIGLLLLVSACYIFIGKYTQFIVSQESAPKTRVGLVLGAGIAKNGQPYDELKARLDSAAVGLSNGTVEKLILSGDNRFKDYDEPTAMYQYLIEQRNIPADRLQRDFAGRSTYESCERAKKVFGLDRVILFSADSHLPRAIYICRHFGIEAYGIGSGVEANNSARREPLARVKAVYNAKIKGEKTILGNPVRID